MSDHLYEFVDACTAAPDDMGPRLVLADWLDEQAAYNHRYETEAARWRWYWGHLIPRFRAMLCPKERHMADALWAGHTNLGPSYGPIILFREMPRPVMPAWACAVIRTFVDQGGGALWDTLTPPFKAFVTALETYLLTETGRVTGQRYNTFYDVFMDSMFIINIPHEVPQHIHATNALRSPNSAGNAAVFHIPIRRHDLTTFQHCLESHLANWQLDTAVRSDKTGNQPIYNFESLVPGWLTRTIGIVNKTNPDREAHKQEKLDAIA